MTQRPNRPPLAERLKQALEEGIQYARGARELAATPVPADTRPGSAACAEVEKACHA